MCPIDSSSSLREENAIVCCSMLGGLTASKCLCDEVGHAEPDLLQFITRWQQVCSTETLSKVCFHFFPLKGGEEIIVCKTLIECTVLVKCVVVLLHFRQKRHSRICVAAACTLSRCHLSQQTCQQCIAWEQKVGIKSARQGCSAMCVIVGSVSTSLL